ncbi:MAG TPA: glycosyltransferase family 39 protein [Terriglobales bacterium]|nr:glycosyltransferase family 39 protein [Terriglobales bacterium]
MLPSAIVVLGLGLRLYYLNHQSVWYDEIFSISVSGRPLREMAQYLVKDFVQPPLHYYILHFWFKLVGFGTYQSRLLSVVLGTLAIVASYCLANYLFGRRAATIAALLLAVSQLGVMYSQEARPYAQLLFLLPCCAYLFMVALRTGRAGPWWAFVCTVTLVVYTHYYGFFAVAAFLLFAFLYRKRYPVPVSRWIGGFLLALVLYLPWLTSGFIGEWHHSSKSLAHAPTRNNLPWWGVLSALNTFNNGRSAGVLDSSPWWTFVLGGLLFGVPALIALQPLLKEPHNPDEQLVRENLAFLALLFIIPFSAGLGVAFKSGAYSIRYITFATVPYYLLVARGMSALHRATLRAAVVVACGAYSLYSLHATYVVPYKEDYRNAYAFLAQSRQPTDCYVAAPPWEERQVQWAWSIYHQGEPAMTLTPLDSFASGQNNCERVWLISVMYQSTPPAVARSKQARAMLEQRYTRIEARRYFWIDLDLYARRNQ